jgi:hypothetical protein
MHKLLAHVQLLLQSTSGSTLAYNTWRVLGTVLLLLAYFAWVYIAQQAANHETVLLATVVVPAVICLIEIVFVEDFTSRVRRLFAAAFLWRISTLLLVDFHQQINALLDGLADFSRTVVIIIAVGILQAVLLIFYSQLESIYTDSSKKARREAEKRFIGPYTRLQTLDAQYLAAHEAGHAVILGLFPHPRKNMRVMIQTLTSGDTNNGLCSAPIWLNHHVPVAFAELDMIMLLAGMEAEHMCTGEKAIGGRGDAECWLERAKALLASDTSGIFYSPPANQEELTYNTKLLTTLKAKHQAIAREILEENMDILLQIRDTLLEKGIFRGQELYSLLKQVRRVPRCPVLSEPVNRALESFQESLDSPLRDDR